MKSDILKKKYRLSLFQNNIIIWTQERRASPRISRMVKSRRFIWADHVASRENGMNVLEKVTNARDKIRKRRFRCEKNINFK